MLSRGGTAEYLAIKNGCVHASGLPEKDLPKAGVNVRSLPEETCERQV